MRGCREFLLLITLLSSAKAGEEYSLDWTEYSRGFRKAHNLTTVLGYQKSHWHNGHSGFGQESESKLFEEQEPVLKMSYAYHLQWLGSFGAILGSSFGFARNFQDSSSKLGSTYYLPGLLMGIVYDLSFKNRILLAWDHYIIREEGLQVEDRVLYIHLTTLLDWVLAYDFFYSLRSAFRIEAHYMRANYDKPFESTQTALDMALNKKELRLGVGFVQHLY